MSDEAPPEKKKKRWFRRIIPSTVAGKSAVATAIALAVLLTVVWCLRLFGADSVRLMHAMTVPRMLIEFVLAAAIPVVLYFGIRHWNQVIEGAYPDIDRAFEAGINALDAQGISPTDYPIFLVLGSTGDEVERGLMEALDTKLGIHGIPNEPGVSHPLQWYQSSDAIYLFCPGASSLSALMHRWTTPSGHGAARRPIAVQTSTPVESSPPQPSPTPSRASSDSYLGTIQFQALSNDAAAGPAGAAPFAMPKPMAQPAGQQGSAPSPQPINRENAMRPAPNYQGTIAFDHYPVKEDNQSAVAVAQRPAVKPAHTRPPVAAPQVPGPAAATNATADSAPVKPLVAASSVALPASLDTSDQLPRLEYVCKLLQRTRRPICGINGAVTLVPFGLSRVGSLQLSALAQSARGDIQTVQNTLGVRVPVTTALVGLEQDKGFSELVRRLQPSLLSRRLGGRFDLRSRPTPLELNSHSDRLCDAFEDWVYRLFGRDDGLAQQRGNRKLYALISKVRHELKPRLRIVLGQAFGCGSDSSEDPTRPDESFFFSGCYFLASGVTTGQPAFVKGVLRDKLLDEQSQVQWTQEAIKVHRRFRLFSITGWVLSLLIAILVILKLV